MNCSTHYVATQHYDVLRHENQLPLVATSQGSNAHFIGLEVETGRTRWANPPADQRAGFKALACIQFEGNSPWLEAILQDGNVIRLNGLTGHEQRRFLADGRTPEQKQAGLSIREPFLCDATLSDDGSAVVSSQMESIYVWNVVSGAIRRRIRHPHRHGCKLKLAPDGRTLAISDFLGNADGEDTIRLFDIETGEQVLTLEPRNNCAIVLAFSPDGKRLFTGSHRGSGIVWDVCR